MASCRTASALIFIYVVLCLSGLKDRRIVFKKEAVVAKQGKLGQKEQSVHLLVQCEKEEFNEIARETLPLERPHLRGNDGIFQGERNRRLRLGCPCGCHHGEFKHRIQTKCEDMPLSIEFPAVQTESTEFDSGEKKFGPLPRQRDFEHSFPDGEGRQARHGHGEEEKGGKEQQHRGWM